MVNLPLFKAIGAGKIFIFLMALFRPLGNQLTCYYFCQQSNLLAKNTICHYVVVTL